MQQNTPATHNLQKEHHNKASMMWQQAMLATVS
jgi:hypothetical protein